MRSNPEQKFQISLVRDLRAILPPDCLLVSYPAGGGGVVRGRFLKASGLIAGFPDLILLHRGNAFCLELKAKHRKPSPEQILMHEHLAVCGVDVRVVRTLDEALGCLKEWEIPTRISA